jgi:hypothetical protein
MNELDDESIRYCALAVLLVLYPMAVAMAATVSDVETVIGPVYIVEANVG